MSVREVVVETRERAVNGHKLVTVCVPDPLTAAAAAGLLQHTFGFTVVPRDQMRTADIVLVSTESGGIDFLQSLRRIHDDGGKHIVVILGAQWTADIFAATSLGLAAIVPRSRISAERLAWTLTIVAKGGVVLPLDVQAVAMRQIRLAQQVFERRDLLACGLHIRELELLRGLAEGMSLDEIGKQMSYSKRTVTNVLHSLTSRLGLRNRTEAVAYAMRAGVL